MTGKSRIKYLRILKNQTKIDMRYKNVFKTRSATSMRQKNQYQKQKTQNKSKQQK